MKQFLFLFATIISTLNFAQTISGDWHARIDIMGTNFPLVMHVNDESTEATLDSPEQQMFGLKIDSFAIVDSKLEFKINSLQFSYKGSILQDSISGRFTQYGFSGKLSFSRKPVPKSLFEKTQTPKPPFNYKIQEITFKNKKDKIKLAGTLTTPAGKDDFPLVVLASGTGPQNRNAEMMGHSFFWVLADYLTKKGIGVLRFDDRGTGKSQGSQQGTTIESFAEDANSAVKYLQKKFKNSKIGIIGHSEGGVHSMLAIQENPDIDFTIFMACIGTNGKEIYVEQHEAILQKDSLDEAVVKKHGKFIGNLIDISAKKDNAEAIKKHLSDYYNSCEEEAIIGKMTEAQFVQSFLSFTNNDWFRGLMAFDATPYLKSMKIPYLSLNGSDDIQVAGKSNYDAFAKFTTNNPKSKAKYLEGLNHLFQKCQTCTIEEYSSIRTTIEPEVLELISEWVLKL